MPVPGGRAPWDDLRNNGISEIVGLRSMDNHLNVYYLRCVPRKSPRAIIFVKRQTSSIRKVITNSKVMITIFTFSQGDTYYTYAQENV